MSEKKTPGSAATLTGATMWAARGVADAFNDDSTTDGSRRQVCELLRHGRQNAVTTGELLRLTGLRSVRQLQDEIARERETGAVILSTCHGRGGYFLPAEGEEGRVEIAAYLRTLRARALNTLRGMRSALRALEVLEGQESWPGMEV